MIEFLCFCGGCVVTMIVVLLAISKKIVGTICFYEQEPPEPPAMTAVLDKPVEEVHKYNYAIFRTSRR